MCVCVCVCVRVCVCVHACVRAFAPNVPCACFPIAAYLTELVHSIVGKYVYNFQPLFTRAEASTLLAYVHAYMDGFVQAMLVLHTLMYLTVRHAVLYRKLHALSLSQ